MTDDALKYRPCPNGHIAEQVIAAAEQCRRGWWCPVCNHWDPALYRERLIEKTTPQPEGKKP